MPEPLSPETRLELAKALLRCPSVENQQNRDAIVNDLTEKIRDRISRGDTPLLDVRNIVDACLNYEGGLELLIDAVRRYEADSLPMREVDRLLAAVPPGPPHPKPLFLAAALVLLALMAMGLALRFSGLRLRPWLEQSTPAPSFTLAPSTVAVQPTSMATPTPTLFPVLAATATPTATSTASLTLTPPPPATPLPGTAWTNPIDGSIYTYVPFGSESFWIKQTEVTNAEYLRCVELGICGGPRLVEELIDPDRGNYPVRGVYLHQARRYAEWAGGRLPTDREWTRACQGPVDRLYPWGFATPDSTRANYGGQVDDTAPVGSYPNGVSPYGVLDLAGNVWEFTDTLWVAGDDESFVIRGGSWQSGGDSLACTDDHRSPYHPVLGDLRRKVRDGFRTNDLGFRVVIIR